MLKLNRVFSLVFKGKVSLYAVLLATEELHDLLLKRPELVTLRQFFLPAEKTDLVPNGMAKVRAGHTTFEEVMMIASYMLKGASPS